MVASNRVAPWRSLMIGVGVALLASACGGGGEEAKDGLIGPEGGTLLLPGGGRLVVPPGALAEPTRLEATSIAAPEGAGFVAVGPFHEFGPAGLAFAKPAVLFVPFDGKGAAADTLGMAWSTDGTTWERLETTVDETAGEMRAEIQHFSKGGPGAWNQPSQVCCIVDLGPKGTEVSLSTDADCNDALSRNPGAKVTILFDLDRCKACCADDWTKKPLVDCKQPATNENPCDPVCCHKGDASPSWVTRGLCVAEGGTPGNEPESECGGCKSSYDCMSLDTDPHDCITVYCIAGRCIRAPSGEGAPCEDGNACTVEDRCDAFGDCKGQPKVCDDPPDPKACFGMGDCNPLTGKCEYPLAAGANCAKDSDCPPGFACDACSCVQTCAKDSDCPDDSYGDCLAPSCWNQRCEVIPKAPGSACDDGDPCTESDQCGSNGECHGTPVDSAACRVCCGDDWTLKPHGACNNIVTSEKCEPTCCALAGQNPLMAVGACEQAGGVKNGDCMVCCKDPAQWYVIPLTMCSQTAAPVEQCENVCCIYQNSFKKGYRGECTDALEILPDWLCDINCCKDVASDGTTVIRVMAGFECDKINEKPGHTASKYDVDQCDVCCADAYNIRNFFDCKHLAADESECERVCCKGEGNGEQYIGVLEKGACKEWNKVPGVVFTYSRLDQGCLVCCLFDYVIKEAASCEGTLPPMKLSECEPVCCVQYGKAEVWPRAVCPDEFETNIPIDQCTNAKLSTCSQPGEAFTGKSAVIQGPLPTQTSTENTTGCPDIWYPDKWPDKGNGPDGVLPIRAPVGSRVVATSYSRGWRLITSLKEVCGQSGCKASSLGNSRPEYPIYTDHTFDDYDHYGTNRISPEQRISERWTATSAELWNSAPKAPKSPLGPFGPLAEDPPAETVEARVVFDTWVQPGQTVEGDITAYYRVVDGPPPNDTAEGAIPLIEGVPQAPEVFAFAQDDYQAAGCTSVPDGTGAGKPDLFYTFTPTASGVYRLEIGVINEDPPKDAFFALLDPSGSCVASGRGGAPFRSPLTLASGTTYTLVVDAGTLSENAVFFVQVDRYNIPGDAAHQAPLHYACASAQAIWGLPFSAEVELSSGFNHVWPQSMCWAIMKNWYLAGDRDLLWSYTPWTDQYVRFTVTSLSEGFRPALLLFEACGSEWLATECLDAVRVPTGETTTSFVRRLTAGQTYFIAAEGGSDAPSAVRVTLEEVAANPDPDDCSNPLVLTNLPAKVTLNARNLDDDVAGSGTVPAQGYCCGPTPCAPVGQGLADAVLAYTATQDGVLDVKFGSPSHGLGTLYATTDVCPSGVLDSCSSLSRSATDISVRLDAGQTAYVVVDGWDNGWFQDITLEASFLPRPTNESCDSAKRVTVLPWQETTTLAFTTNDVTAYPYGHCSPLVKSYGDYTSGGDLVWVFDPGATEKDLVVGLLSANFSGYNSPSMYVLESCGPMPTSDCWDEFLYEWGSYVGNHITLWGVDAPIWIVVDHRMEDVPGTFTWMAQEVTVPANDTCATAIPVTSLPFREVANNVAAVNDYSLDPGNTCEPYGASVGLGPDVVYRLEITAEILTTYRSIQFRTPEASYGVSLMAFQNGCDPATDCVAAKNYRYLTVPLDGFVAGDVLYLVVDGMVSSAKGSGMFVIEIQGS